GGWRINMLDGQPVLRAGGRDGPTTISLSVGAAIEGIDEAAVRRVTEAFAAGNGVNGAIRTLETIRVDQWTAQTARRNQPLWRAQFHDTATTWVYVNGTAGEEFQHATRGERWLKWFGAV